MTSLKTPEKHFPRLDIHILKTHAERWIEKFPEAPIKRISLYSISFQLEGYVPDIIESYKPNPAIYAVVFDVDAEDKTINMTPDERMEYDILCIRREAALHLDMEPNERLLLARQHPLESYERLYSATQPNLRRSDFKNLPLKYLELVTADFANVYKWPAKDNYLEEWRFIVKFKNTELNADIRTEDPFVILALNLKGLITEAAPEVESLFKAIKKVGFSGRNPDANDETWQKVTLQHFDKNQKQFNFVKREYLEDKDLYAFADGQASRDFKGCLHQKIIEGKGLKKQNAHNLANLHNTILPNK